MQTPHPALRRVLETIHAAGEFVINDGDQDPFDAGIIAEAEKRGFISVDSGDAWRPATSYTLKPNGKRALGIDIPPTLPEQIVEFFRRKLLRQAA